MKIHFLDKNSLDGDLATYSCIFTDNEMLDTNKKLVIFGAGLYGYELKKVLESVEDGLWSRAFAFIDNDKSKVGKKLSGLEVFSTQLIKERPQDFCVIIAVNSNRSHVFIRKQLLGYGISDESIGHYKPIWTLDYDEFNDERVLPAFVDAYSEIYREVQISTLNEQGFFWKAYWSASSMYSKSICKWILEKCENKKQTGMLDIGPGAGLQSIAFKKLLDVDITWMNLTDSSNELTKKHGIKVIVGNVETDEIDIEERFDIIMLSQVLEHFHFNPVATMNKIKKWLKPDGTLYVGVPNVAVTKGPSIYDSWDEMPVYSPNSNLPELLESDYGEHVKEPTYDEMIHLFKEVDLYVDKFEYSCKGNIMEFALKFNNGVA